MSGETTTLHSVSARGEGSHQRVRALPRYKHTHTHTHTRARSNARVTPSCEHARAYCSTCTCVMTIACSHPFSRPRSSTAPRSPALPCTCAHTTTAATTCTTTMTTTHSFSTTTTTTTTTDHRHLCQDFTYDHSFWSCSTDDEHFAGQEHVFNKLGLDVLDNAFEGYVYPPLIAKCNVFVNSLCNLTSCPSSPLCLRLHAIPSSPSAH
jgi:hypothetical protein